MADLSRRVLLKIKKLASSVKKKLLARLKSWPDAFCPERGILSKKFLLLTVLALFFATGAMGILFISTQVAAVPERLEREITPRGAVNDHEALLADQGVRQSMTEESWQSSREEQQAQRSRSLALVTDWLSELKDSRDWLVAQESERLRQELIRNLERDLKQWQEEVRAAANREIDRKQQQIEEDIAAIDIGYDPEDEELLRQIRREAQAEYRQELLSIRIKQRTMPLTAQQEIELRQRREEIETQVEAQVDQVRSIFDAQIDQQLMREAALLRLEFVSAQEEIQQQASEAIAERERELDNWQQAWEKSEEERVTRELTELEERLQTQSQRLYDRQLDFW